MKSIKLIFLFIVHLATVAALREEFKYTEVHLKGSCPIIKYVNNLSMSRIVGWYSQAFSSANNSLCFNNEGQTVKVASFDNRTLSVQYCCRSPTDPDVADCGYKSGTSSLDEFFYQTGIDDNGLHVLYTNYNDLTIAYGCRPSCKGSGRDELILILSSDYTLSPALETRALTVLENNGIKFSNAKFVKRCRTKGIKEASTDEEIIACYPVITELYPHIQCKDELVTKVKLQKEMGYRLLYIKDKETNRVASFCGFRITNCLSTGKTLYLEDLCTLPFARCMWCKYIAKEII